MFETETMADLLWEQGHGAQAIALCRRVLVRASGEERRRLETKATDWQARLPQRPATESLGKRSMAPRGQGEHAEGEASSIALALTPAGLSLAWSLPPREEAPVAELFVVRRKRPEGILDVQRRTLPLGAFTGTLELPIADLHSARAAAGFLETNQFRPLARSELLKVEGVAPRDEAPRR